MPKRILSGVVVSDKGDKTVKVAVRRTVTHERYKKVIRTVKNYAAHDEKNQFKIGDQVKIIECRPRSKTKTWEVIYGDAEEAKKATKKAKA